MFKKTLIAALVSGVMVSGVQAAEIQPNGYLFGNVGRSDADTPRFVKELDSELSAFGEATGLDFGSSFDENDTAFKVGAGIQLNRHVAVEFQYLDLGKAAYKASMTDGIDTISAKMAGDTEGFGANLVGTLPFDRFKLFGKVGYHKLKTKVKEEIELVGEGTLFDESESHTEWVNSLGVGASFAFTPTVELVAEYEQYRDVADEYDVDFASIGLRYNF